MVFILIGNNSNTPAVDAQGWPAGVRYNLRLARGKMAVWVRGGIVLINSNKSLKHLIDSC